MQVGAHGDAADDAVGEHRDQHAERRYDESVAVAGAAHPERSDRHRQRRDADERR